MPVEILSTDIFSLTYGENIITEETDEEHKINCVNCQGGY